MLKTLLESLVIEVQEKNKDLKETITNIYEGIDSNFTTDLQKEIKESEMTLNDIFNLVNEILQNEDFKEELDSIDLEIPELIDTIEYAAFNNDVNTFMSIDSNGSYNEILEDNSFNIDEAIKELIEVYNNFKEDNKDITLNLDIFKLDKYKQLE